MHLNKFNNINHNTNLNDLIGIVCLNKIKMLLKSDGVQIKISKFSSYMAFINIITFDESSLFLKRIPQNMLLVISFLSFGLSTEVPKLTHYGVVLFLPRA